MTLCSLCRSHEAETTEILGFKATRCPEIPRGTAYATSGDPFETFRLIAQGPRVFDEGTGTDEAYASAVASVIKITEMSDE